MTTTVSVIIPTFNCAHFLSEALESVLSQSSPPSEIIVVDDGSTDDTQEVLGRYAGRVATVQLPHQGRPGYARNRGIEVSKGEIVAFLDADDQWKRDKLSEQLAILHERPEIGLVHSNLDVVDEQGTYLRPFFVGCDGSRGACDTSTETSFHQLMMGDAGLMTTTVVVRRECLDTCGLFHENLKVGEDWYLWMRIARLRRIAFIDRPLANHRKHGANTGSHSVPVGSVPQVQLWKELASELPELWDEYPCVMHGKFVMHYLLGALRCAKHGQYRSAVALGLKCLSANPLRMGAREAWRNFGKLRALRESQRRAIRTSTGSALIRRRSKG